MIAVRRNFLSQLLVLTAILLWAAGCASPGTRPAPPVSMPLGDALTSLGSVRVVDGPSAAEVVLLKDRHAVGPGIFYVDEELREFQRDQHFVMTHLVARGFNLLGCELTLGPIPRNGAALDNIDVIEQARATGDDLNRWSVFQPLRYEIEFKGRLEVLGVEDPALYQEDIDTLEKIEKVMMAQRFNDSLGPKPQDLAAEQTRLLRKIRANVHARGSLAAKNLLALMNERGSQKAVLMLGASHIPAASEELAKAGVKHYVYEAPSFQRSAKN